MFQSALPHGERRAGHAGLRDQDLVSIRAPAWGATSGRPARVAIVHVSIRAPAWGATRLRLFALHGRLGFNPRSRMGSDQGTAASGGRGAGFNPRSRMGSDVVNGADEDLFSKFQSALPHGERLRIERLITTYETFQSALPHGERRGHAGLVAAFLAFQSALPHGERPAALAEAKAALMVSIRAPAWGATGADGRNRQVFCVSIRAPAWGATRQARLLADRVGFQSALPHGERLPSRPAQVSEPEFQSALPHGERPHIAIHRISGADVSIRAPAWGATCSKKRVTPSGRGFNPRSRMGSDRRRKTTSSGVGAFQSALPHGERPHRVRWPRARSRFNPRSRMGSDARRPLDRHRHEVSIRAPAWGATVFLGVSGL